MMRPSLRRPALTVFAEYERNAIQRMEQAALVATDRAAKGALADMRTAFSGSGLGRLGNALGYGSDLRKGRGIKRFGASGFSASGWVHVRAPSERVLGALEAYTEGADIRPVKGRWLWIATDQIPARAGRYRMTPQRYVERGLEAKIGPLVFVRSINGRPLLVVKTASISASGKARSAKALRRNGQPRKGQRAKEFIVAFVGIPRTSRAARVDPRAVVGAKVRQMSDYFREAVGR